MEAAKDEDSYKDEDDMEAKIEIVKLLEAAQSGGWQLIRQFLAQKDT